MATSSDARKPMAGMAAKPATSAPTTAPRPTAEPATEPPASQVGTGSCDADLGTVLRGAEEVFGSEPFSYWVKGDRFTVCYRSAERTTLTQPLPLVPQHAAATYAVISLYTADGRTLRAAGGAVPQGAPAFAVDYTFPDGHTEPAQIGTDAQGRTILDFNFAYNPSCAYSVRYICPLSPRENRLPVPVRGGERQPA